MDLETLDGSTWDVLIAGTGLHESLLALALSRSGKKILHVDKNGYYGGGSAALSLQEAEEWAKRYSSPDPVSSFAKASITTQQSSSLESSDTGPKLAFSRAYSLALAPQIIYTQSAILPALVSSRVDSQLDFLAVGSFFVLEPNSQDSGQQEDAQRRGSLIRVPSTREDVFADTSLEPKDKRGLMKFIKFVVGLEDGPNISDEDELRPFDEFLSSHFKLSPTVQHPVQALTLSLSSPNDTEAKYAIARIVRHLTSIGVFGPGFGSVSPKWGGLAEISQVGCRACAVGGAVYVLGNGIESISVAEDLVQTTETGPDSDHRKWQVQLQQGEKISAKWIASGRDNVTSDQLNLMGGVQVNEKSQPRVISRLVLVVSSPLEQLFPQTVDGAPVPAVAIVHCPDSKLFSNRADHDIKPIHIILHSSDTGECPIGQCILYCTVALDAEVGYEVLNNAAASFLQSVDSEAVPQILWKLEYEQYFNDGTHNSRSSNSGEAEKNAIVFPDPSPDLAFDDETLRQVRRAWQKIMGPDAEDFMMFAPRETLGDEQEDQ